MNLKNEGSPHEELAQLVLRKSKYKHIHRGLVEYIAESEILKGRKQKETLKAVLSKLHQVGAAYFSQKPDYQEWKKTLSTIPKDIHSDQAMDFCRQLMGHHHSTEERLPVLHEFYEQILKPIRPIPSILDLACGLNPLALSWMPANESTKYYGCDIFTDMIDFLNIFASHFNINGGFHTCNLLDTDFQQSVKITFLLKVAPCLEQLRKGFIPQLLKSIPSDFILFSYPVSSLSGMNKGMRDTYFKQFTSIVSSRKWEIERFDFSTELAFLVKK